MTRGFVVAFCLFVGGLLCLEPPARAWWQSVQQVAISGFTASCTESTNFIARETSPDATQRSRGDTLLCGLVTDGLCCAASGGVLDGLYVWATNSTTNALLNWTQNAFNATSNGSGTFTASVGYTGNATDFYLNTGFNPATASGNWTQNSASYGCYILSNRSTNQNWAVFGNSVTLESRLVPKYSGGVYWGVNNTVVTPPASSNAQASWAASRTGATATNLYINSNATPIDTTLAVSGSPDSANLFAFAYNANGSAGQFTGDQMSACWWGAGVSAANAVKIMDRLNTYMTAYGINVY